MNGPTAGGLVGAVLLAILGSQGLTAFVNMLGNRKKVSASAAAELNESTLEWAQQLQADAAGARKEAREARAEAGDAHRAMTSVRREAEGLAAQLRALRVAIFDPDITLARLRELARNDARNGRLDDEC